MTEPIGTTDNHPFWSEDRWDFIPAGNLKIGEHLRLIDGSQTTVTSITQRGPPQRAYNLEVNNQHVFYVTQAGVLVHNNCMTGDQIALKDLVEEVSLGGRKPISGADAETLLDWADEVNYPGWRASASDLAPTKNHWVGGPHIHFEGVRNGHIPVANPELITPR